MFPASGHRHLEPFPSPDEATADGLVAIGGELTPQRLLLAYHSGIFPWFEEDCPVLWWSPDPRAILELDQLHVSRRLMRTYRQGPVELTVNRDFEGVMRGCADGRAEGTWITGSMIRAYCDLHRLGYAHSVEAWQGERLVGGIYGVAIGGLFAGESMFHRRRDASKLALIHLVTHLRQRGFVLFDVQILNEHTARLGAIEIPRREYLRRLNAAVQMPMKFA